MEETEKSSNNCITVLFKHYTMGDTRGIKSNENQEDFLEEEIFEPSL